MAVIWASKAGSSRRSSILWQAWLAVVRSRPNAAATRAIGQA